MYYKNEIDKNLFKNELSKIINMPIASIWNGLNNSIGLEIGKLHEESFSTTIKGHVKNLVGDWTLTISGEWYVSDPNKKEEIITDSNAVSGIRKLVGLKISDVSLNTDKNLVIIKLSNKILLDVRKNEMGLIGIVYNHKKYLDYNGENFSEIRYPNK